VVYAWDARAARLRFLARDAETSMIGDAEASVNGSAPRPAGAGRPGQAGGSV
jgi:hypothetical protein